MSDLFFVRKIAVLLAFAMLGVACESVPIAENTPIEDEPQQPTEQLSYTFMLYGCGGGNLDESFEKLCWSPTSLDDVPQNINIVEQVAWSKGFKPKKMGGEKGSVSRYVYSHDTNSFCVEHLCDSASFSVEESANLEDFIKWAKEVAPADEYIIIFCGHGNAWHPAFDGDTRGVLRDDATGQYLGLRSIVKAVKATKTHFNMMMFASCLMGNIEYVAELSPYADYYFASNHVTSISGDELRLMVDALARMPGYNEDSIARAVDELLERDYKEFWMWWPLSVDHTLTKCCDVHKLLLAYRRFADRLVEVYGDNKMVIDAAMQSSYDFMSQAFTPDEIREMDSSRMSYSYDMVDLATNIAVAVGDAQLSKAAADVKAAAGEAIVSQRSVNVNDVERVYYAINLVNSTMWAELGFEQGGYCDTRFDKATGWSRVLQMNDAVHPAFRK